MPEAEAQSPVQFTFKSGVRAPLVYTTPTLHIRLPIDPEEAASKDDRFTLTSADGTYEKVLTVRDDAVEGDAFVDLVFDNLRQSAAYTLEVDPGAEGTPYALFEEVPYGELVEHYALLQPGDRLEELEEEEEETVEKGEEIDWEDEGTNQEQWGGDCEDEIGPHVSWVEIPEDWDEEVIT